MGTVRVVVADDHVLVRAGIEMLIGTEGGFEVVASCRTYDELLAAVERERPEIVVTDIRMPPTNTDEGIRAAQAMSASHPEIGIVVLSQYLEAAYALALIDGGSSGRAYLLKDHVADPGHLLTALRAVATGGSYIDPAVVDAMFQAQRSRGPLQGLTERELQILGEIASGRSNNSIAEELFISEKAVEKHINSLFMKLGLPPDQASHRRVKAVLLFLDEMR